MRKIRNKPLFSSSISIIISLSLVIFIVGILCLLPVTINNYINREKENFEFTIHLNENIDNKNFSLKKDDFKDYLLSSPFFKHVYFINKIEIANEYDLDLEMFSINEIPFQHSFNATVNAKYLTKEGMVKVKRYIHNYDENSESKFIGSILSQEKDIIQMNNNVKDMTLFLLPFCVVFFLVAFALINNTIRLSIYSERLLIRTMRLVGATNMFIQKPYLFNSIYQGALSSIIAIFMLIGCVEFIEQVDPNIIEEGDFNMISIIFGIILIFGVIISLISTFFAVRKYLKLNEQELYN